MDQLSIVDKWGKKRKAELIVCKTCNREVIRRIFTTRVNKYCSPACFNQTRKTRKKLNCLYCAKEFERSLGNIKKINFCSRVCKDTYSRKENHPNWKGGTFTYRKNALEKYGPQCKSGIKCPLNTIHLPDFLLEVDHINGNHADNRIDNLQVLCVWCHKIKTWGIGDKGSTLLLQSKREGSVPSFSTST